MLDGKPLLVLEKTQPTSRGRLKLFNLGFGAVAVDVTDEEQFVELRAMATEAVRAMSLRLASVDIVRLPDGSLRILEVNDGITLDHYARQSEAYKKRAVSVYDAIVASMFK
jgi:glutathione synthase/RimK-type ligase-like ATP-grasp enzyme